ncbi:MAG: 7TM domain-containing protein [Patescibacteria group bacterium]|nr:7TM domain-containing protein [Patescibacteria group bacterium]
MVILLLLMPLGALVTAVFRTLVGIRTFGTFTPVLLALSFVYADWQTGLAVFAVVLVLGLATRGLLDRLKLLLVPRLSVILTLVVISLVFAVSLLDYLGLTPGADAVLFPMVILTMIIERFYVSTEEDGLGSSLHSLLGTLLVGACCYFILQGEQVGRLLLAYPELHLFSLALLIVMGRYTGYRLTELWRFRDFAASQSTDIQPAT